MTFTWRAGVREKIGGLIGVSGPSGSGKTYTALLIAKGLANGTGVIAVIDTEAGRALHYAPRPGEAADPANGTFKFMHIDFPPPFTPERYVEAIRYAEGEGATVIVIDSMSHEWSGEGGCSDMQAMEAERMARRSVGTSGRPWESAVDAMTAPAWAKPKMRHKRMVQKLLQSRAHLIFCLRAEEKIKIIDRKVVPQGFMPICEKSWPFEMTCSFMLHPDRPGCPDYSLQYKLNRELRAILPDGQLVTEEAGKRLRGWLESGADKASPDKIAEGVRDLIERLQDASSHNELEAITREPEVLKQRKWLGVNRPDMAERVTNALMAMLALYETADAVVQNEDAA